MIRSAVVAALSVVVGLANAATFTVTNKNDTGAGSLRDAISQANTAGGVNTVQFQAGVAGTIVLTSGQIRIGGATSIVGPGAGVLTINGNSSSRIFSIFATDPPCPALDGPDYLVSISGLTLSNGRRNSDSPGGAIFSEHSLALNDVVVKDSIARSGGGLAVQSQYAGQSLSITNAKFINNVAKTLVPTSNPNNAGGGVVVLDRCAVRTTPFAVTVANSVFSGNRSQPVAVSGMGGALTTFSYADITITDTRFVDNHVDVPNPPISGQTYRGGAIFGTAKSLTITRSEISDNSVMDATGTAQVLSGAMHIYNDAVDLQTPGSVFPVKIINSTISGNSTSATAGAMWTHGHISLEFQNSTVINNSAASNRTGGIVLSTGPTSPASARNANAPTLKLVSTILANSSATTVDVATNPAVIPSFTVDATNSLIENLCLSCNMSVSGTGNLSAVDPMLGSLVFIGGSSRIHPLLAGSPAIDAGSNLLGLPTDQRGTGFLRVIGASADMGAIEFNLATRTSISSVNFSSPSPVGISLNTGYNVVQISSQNSDGMPAVVGVDTAVGLTLAAGTGVLGGSVGCVILAGTSSCLIVGLTYSVTEAGVVFTVSVTSGQSLLSANAPPATVVTPTLDIDLNGTSDALTDGLVTIRYLVGLSGNSLISGAIGAGALRTSAGSVSGYLGGMSQFLDVDGNGTTDAFTDGLLILRYLFGLRGPALIVGAIGQDASRFLADEVENYLKTLIFGRSVVEPPIFSGSFVPPDRAELANIPLPPMTGRPGIALLEIPEGTFYFDPAERTPVTAAAECATVVLSCYQPGARNWEGCLANVPQCANNTPWLGNEAMCCSQACSGRYKTLREAGADGPTAFTKAIFDAPSCIPGVAGQVQLVNP